MNNLYYDLAKRFVRARLPEKMRGVWRPIKLSVACTYRCNSRCTYCDIWRIYQDQPKKAEEELTLADFENIFREMGRHLLYLDWCGGEPFLRTDTCEILLAASRLCPRLGSVVVATNGSLTKRVLEYMSRLTAEAPQIKWAVGVSLDGDRETHNLVRGHDRAYDAAIETIRSLQELSKSRVNLEVKIHYTLGRVNAGRFQSFDETVLRPLGLSVGDVGFNLEISGNIFQTKQDDVNAVVGGIYAPEIRHKVEADVAYYQAQLRQEKLTLSQRLKGAYREFFLAKIPGYLANPRQMVIPCQASRNSIYIDAYGNIFPCIIWSKRLGNVREGIGKVLDSATTAEARAMIDSCNGCPKCWNACEAIPTLLTSPHLPGCFLRSLVRR